MRRDVKNCILLPNIFVLTISILLLEKQPWEKVFNFYCAAEEPLLVVKDVPTGKILTPNIVLAKLKPLSKTVIIECVGRNEYSRHFEGGHTKPLDEIVNDLSKEQEWAYTHCLSILIKEGIKYEGRERAILVDVG